MPFRKGDPEGNRWLEQEPLYICWSEDNVDFLFTHSGRRSSQMPVMRNPEFFLVSGVSWTRGANHVPIKAKLVEPAIMDVNAMKLSPMESCNLSAEFLLALFNSEAFSYFLKKFIAHTWMAQISDVRMMPIVIPTRAQHTRLKELAQLCMEAKRAEFTNQPPSNPLVARTRAIASELRADAPAYLHPGAQQMLLETPRACLAVLESAVSWEAEKLYGVEGLGPFDEF